MQAVKRINHTKITMTISNTELLDITSAIDSRIIELQSKQTIYSQDNSAEYIRKLQSLNSKLENMQR